MVVIASGKGGVGKSTLSANLGIALGAMQRQVCIFDADTNLANINILFGLRPEHTLQDYIAGNKPLDQILIPVADHLQIVPAASGVAEFVDLEPQQQTRLLDGLQEIEQQHDLILIDSAAGIGSSQLSFFLAAACAILVITPEPTSLTDAFSFLKMAKRYGFKRTVYVLVNLASDLHEARTAFKRFKQATEKYLQLDVGYLGYVLHDPYVPESVRRQTPVMHYKPECLASRCVRAIAERLTRLLQNDKTDSTTFSCYLSEMNHPFGIELQPPDGPLRDASEPAGQPDDWQGPALQHLCQLDRRQAMDFLRRAAQEWSTQHDADESLLTGDAGHPGIEVLVPARESASERRATMLSMLKGEGGNRTAESTLHQSQNQEPERAYWTAIQFAELLARVERD